MQNKKTPRPCKHPGCAAIVREGSYCDKHKRDAYKADAGRRASAEWHGLYYTAAWRDRRAAQLLREPFCKICEAEGRRRYATDVDHVKPHKGDKVLFDDDNNLQSLCHSCHSRKTAAERQAPPGRRKF
jgi:5-methylcytosine-specific restriction protein A